jgi:hypothetical protein
MASTYSTNLAIELIGTGDQAGTWGNTTNTNLGTLIEQAISGYVTQAVSTGTDTTITIPNGATGVARNMYIELTGTGGASTNLIVPANKKLYFIFNNTSSGQVTVKVSGQTGVSVPNKAKVILVSNGTDVIDATNYIGSATIGNLTATSGTITTLASTSAIITTLTGTSMNVTTATHASANITQLNSTSGTISTLASTSAAVTTISGTTLTYSSASITNLTATSLVLSNLSIASANVTTLTAGSATITNLIGNSLTISSGTANGVLFLNGSKVATSGTALTFDGTLLKVGSPTNAPNTNLSGNLLQVKSSSGFSYLTMGNGDGANNNTYIGSASSIATFGTVTDAGVTTELMRLTSTGLGIGTSSPQDKVSVLTAQGLNTPANPVMTYGANTDWAAGFANIYDASYVDQFMLLNCRMTGGTRAAPTFNASSPANGGIVLKVDGLDGGLNVMTVPNGTGQSATSRLYLNPSGNLGVGSSTPSSTGLDTGSTRLFVVAPNSDFGAAGTFVCDSLGRGLLITNQAKNTTATIAIGSSLVQFGSQSNTPCAFLTNNTERARIDAAGNFGLGVTPSAWGSIFNAMQLGDGGFIAGRSDVFTQLQLGCNGYYDGSNFKFLGTGRAARYYQDGGEHYWETSASGTAGGTISFTQAMTLTSGGDLLVGKTTDTNDAAGVTIAASGYGRFVRDSNTVLIVNRLTNDGTLVSLQQAGTEEGTISVSGNTVSYNAFAGSHWSQLQDGSKPDILRGTVMESINELCVWPGENNERLPKAKISDTAGSKKVYGVFMAWDNDWTTTNDMYVTAVGAFICRVNGSVTVQEGDLLESNGDGTARVQADDIIRSSTIGKVTSTVKTHEYDDGSYCVPTVLYCG